MTHFSYSKSQIMCPIHSILDFVCLSHNLRQLLFSKGLIASSFLSFFYFYFYFLTEEVKQPLLFSLSLFFFLKYAIIDPYICPMVLVSLMAIRQFPSLVRDDMIVKTTTIPNFTYYNKYY